NQPPQILTQPQSKTVAIGQSATFSVEANSFDPISYQWFLKSFFIRGATSAVFAIPNVQTTNAGTYRVRVTNQFGEVTSAPAELTVLGSELQPPFIITQPKN